MASSRARATYHLTTSTTHPNAVILADAFANQARRSEFSVAFIDLSITIVIFAVTEFTTSRIEFFTFIHFIAPFLVIRYNGGNRVNITFVGVAARKDVVGVAALTTNEEPRVDTLAKPNITSFSLETRPRSPTGNSSSILLSQSSSSPSHSSIPGLTFCKQLRSPLVQMTLPGAQTPKRPVSQSSPCSGNTWSTAPSHRCRDHHRSLQIRSASQ